jgi:hypothetical protein
MTGKGNHVAWAADAVALTSGAAAQMTKRY